MAWIRCTGNTGGSLKVRTASGAIASFETNLAEPLQSVKCEINATGGNGTPDNPNPIVGYSEANITRCGVNLWDEEWENGDISSSTGEKITGNLVISKNYIPVKPNTTYYSTMTLRTRWYDAQKNYIGTAPTITANATFTVPANAHFFMFTTQAGYGSTYNNDISINYPATDTTYHAYNGQTYTIAFGQTVYGGVLDVTRGKLTVTHGYVVYDGSNDEVWALTGTRQYIQQPDTVGGNYVETAGKFFSNCLVYNPTIISDSSAIGIILNNKNFQIRVSTSVTTVAELRQYLAQSPLTVAYELATPFDIDLTPVQIEALLGVNNVWHDGNGDTEVKYLEVVRS